MAAIRRFSSSALSAFSGIRGIVVETVGIASQHLPPQHKSVCDLLDNRAIEAYACSHGPNAKPLGASQGTRHGKGSCRSPYGGSSRNPEGCRGVASVPRLDVQQRIAQFYETTPVVIWPVDDEAAA